MRMARPWSRVHTLAAETVLDPVGPFQRFGFVLEPLHGYNRPEYLLLYHLIFLAKTGHNRRGETVTTLAHSLASREHLGVGRARASTKPLDSVQLVDVIEWAIVGVVLAEGAHDRAACLLHQGIEEVGMDLRADQDPRRGGAILSGVEKGGRGDALGGGRHVGVVEDDGRRLPAEFQMDTLQIRWPRRWQLPSRPGRSR